MIHISGDNWVVICKGLLSHIPQYTTKEEKCTHFCSKVVHCGIRSKCIVGFVRLFYFCNLAINPVSSRLNLLIVNTANNPTSRFGKLIGVECELHFVKTEPFFVMFWKEIKFTNTTNAYGNSRYGPGSCWPLVNFFFFFPLRGIFLTSWMV